MIAAPVRQGTPEQLERDKIMNVSKWAEYWKFYLALLTPVFVAIDSAITDGAFTNTEVVTVSGAFVGALLVLFGPRNKTSDTETLSRHQY